MDRSLLLYLNCVFSLLLVDAFAQQAAFTQPQVTLDVGTLKGFYQETQGGRQIASFQSIPYVKQPMGRHRFKNSIEMGPWLGVYDATGDAPDCLQYPPTVNGPTSGSEDCLYVNVYTPYVPSGTQVKPLMDVLIYIHGGAFMYYGSKYLTPKYLLDKDLVLVTTNYRMGSLGFMSTEDGTLPGNAGMKDQVMALRWVHRYISSFGGDPNKVTLAGHSAGGAAVHYHLLSPLSKGLFQKAIIGSGSALNPWAKAENVKEKTVALATKLGCAFQDFNLLVKCLRSRPANHIAGFSEQLIGWNNMPLAPFAPSVEPIPIVQNPPGTPEPFLTDEPLTIITSGQANDVPVLFSFIPIEGSIPAAYFVFDDASREELFTRWDELLPLVLDFSYTANPSNYSQISQAIKQHYLQGINVADRATAIESLVKMIGDRLFIAGIAEASRLHAQVYTSPVYTIRFSYKAAWSDLAWACNCSDNLPGALHYEDAGFLVDNTFPAFTSELDKQVQSRLIDLWYSFITTGKPLYGGVAVPEVKTTLPSLSYLDIGPDGNPSILSEADPGEINLWKSLSLSDNLQPIPTAQKMHTEL